MRESAHFLLGLGLVAAFTTSLPAAVPPPVGEQVASAAEARYAAASAPLVVASTGVVELRIDIVPTTASRKLRVVADSGSHVRSTTIQLHGEDSARQHVLEWTGLPVGTYEVLGTLVDAAGHDQIAVRGYLRVID